MTLAAALLGVSTLIPTPAWAEKVDDDLLQGGDFQPIFVRFEPQMLKSREDYAAFAARNEKRKRLELRKEVLTRLKADAEGSWKGAEATIESLTQKGLLRDTARFWIVNGFAADAKPEACRELASRPDVAFVYLQRSPNNLRQHAKAEPAASTSGIYWDRTSEVAKPYAHPKVEGTEGALSWNLEKIKAPEAWREGAKGQGVIVAISDSGIDPVPALREAFWRNSKEKLNRKDDDGNGFVDDLFGYDFNRQSGLTFGGAGQFHGTMCAGIVAGRSVKGAPFRTGVAPESKIMVLNGMGPLRVFEYALANGADILSMSWMWPNFELGHYRGVYRLALEHLSAGGVLPVGGAGNFATSAPAGKQICLPKDIPCCLSVAGILSDGKRPVFSSMGPVSWKGVKFYDDDPTPSKPDLTAPNGEFPVWALADDLPSRDWKVRWRGEGGASLIEGPRGNSFAGPHVAGVAALVLSVKKDLKPWQLKRLLEETCDDLESPGWDKESGAGLVNAQRALAKAKAQKG